MNQHMLKLYLPRGISIGPNELREATAKVLNGQENCHRFFHYDENGKPLNEKPAYRFVGGKGFVGFVSERSEEDIKDLMYPVLQAIQTPKLFSMLNGLMPKVQILQFEKKAFVTQEPNVYLVSRCIDKKEHRKALGEEGRLTVLFKSMLAQAVKEGVLTALPDDQDLQLQFASVRDLGLETQFQNQNKKWMHMMHAQFIANIDLQGIWQMGGMTSRGHGLIFKQNKKGVFQSCL